MAAAIAAAAASFFLFVRFRVFVFSSVRYFEIRVFECFFRVLRFCVFKVVFFLFLTVRDLKVCRFYLSNGQPRPHGQKTEPL
jgi:hypothetical protein